MEFTHQNPSLNVLKKALYVFAVMFITFSRKFNGEEVIVLLNRGNKM